MENCLRKIEKVFEIPLTKEEKCSIIPMLLNQRQQVTVKAQATLPRRDLISITMIIISLFSRGLCEERLFCFLYNLKRRIYKCPARKF